ARSVLRTLSLEKARDTKVGGKTTGGASGGERKRVAVGCELVTSPKLLCLDECTFIFQFCQAPTDFAQVPLVLTHTLPCLSYPPCNKSLAYTSPYSAPFTSHPLRYSLNLIKSFSWHLVA